MTLEQKNADTDHFLAIKEIQVMQGKHAARIDILFFDSQQDYMDA